MRFLDGNEAWILFYALLSCLVRLPDGKDGVEFLAQVQQIESPLKTQFSLHEQHFCRLRRIIETLYTFLKQIVDFFKALVIFRDQDVCSFEQTLYVEFMKLIAGF